MAQEFYHPREVAQEFGVSLRTVQHWAKTGQLVCIRLPSGHIRIPAEEVARLRTPVEVGVA